MRSRHTTCLIRSLFHGKRRCSLPLTSLLCSLIVVAVCCRIGDASDPKKKKGDDPQKLSKKSWEVLWDSHRTAGGTRPLAEDGPLHSLKDLQLQGVPKADPFWLHDFKSSGVWGSIDHRLARIEGENAAVKLIRAENFELQGSVKAEGLGGWFILFGWDKGHGYAIYNVSIKLSGSPWIVSEFRDSKAISRTHREIHRYQWKGEQPLFLSVENKKLSLQVGREKIAKDLELPNYHTGDIILGTYDTPYGAKPVSVRSLRIRAK